MPRKATNPLKKETQEYLEKFFKIEFENLTNPTVDADDRNLLYQKKFEELTQEYQQ